MTQLKVAARDTLTTETEDSMLETSEIFNPGHNIFGCLYSKTIAAKYIFYLPNYKIKCNSTTQTQ